MFTDRISGLRGLGRRPNRNNRISIGNIRCSRFPPLLPSSIAMPDLTGAATETLNEEIGYFGNRSCSDDLDRLRL